MKPSERIKKYIVCGDWVTSISDGDEHYVRSEELVRLYRLDYRDCILCESIRVETLAGLPKDLPILKPRHDGNYKEHS